MKVINHVTRVDNIKDISCWCGVYILHLVSKDIYIGSTENFKKRLYQHKDKDIEYIELYVTDTVECARCLESDLILDLQPEVNKIGKKIICQNDYIKYLKEAKENKEKTKENAKNIRSVRLKRGLLTNDITRHCFFFRKSSTSCIIGKRTCYDCDDHKIK